MINNPLFRKLKENSLWWILVAAFVLMLGIVTVNTGIGIDPTRILLAEEAPGNVHIYLFGDQTYLIILYDKKEDAPNIAYRVTDEGLTTESSAEALRKYLEGKGISVDNLTFPAPPKNIPSNAEQLLNAQLSVVRIRTQEKKIFGRDDFGRPTEIEPLGVGSGFSIGEYKNKEGKCREAIITNNHVISRDIDKKVTIEIFDENGKLIKTVEGIVHEADSGPDLAIISIPCVKELLSIIISSTPPKPGDRVVQIGCPKGAKPTPFPVPPPFRTCVVIKSNFIGPSGEIIFIDPDKNIGVAGGRSGGPIVGTDPKTGMLAVVGVCNSRDDSTRPPGNIGCSSTSLNNFIDKVGFDIILEMNKEERRAFIEAQR